MVCRSRGRRAVNTLSPKLTAILIIKLTQARGVIDLEQLVPAHRNDLPQTRGTTTYCYRSRHVLASKGDAMARKFLTPASKRTPDVRQRLRLAGTHLRLLIEGF